MKLWAMPKKRNSYSRFPNTRNQSSSQNTASSNNSCKLHKIISITYSAKEQSENIEDNEFIFEEMMKNEIIKNEFEKVRETFGDEAFELNKKNLL